MAQPGDVIWADQRAWHLLHDGTGWASPGRGNSWQYLDGAELRAFADHVVLVADGAVAWPDNRSGRMFWAFITSDSSGVTETVLLATGVRHDHCTVIEWHQGPDGQRRVIGVYTPHGGMQALRDLHGATITWA